MIRQHKKLYTTKNSPRNKWMREQKVSAQENAVNIRFDLPLLSVPSSLGTRLISTASLIPPFVFFATEPAVPVRTVRPVADI